MPFSKTQVLKPQWIQPGLGRKRRFAFLAFVALLSAGLAAADNKPDIKRLGIEPLEIKAERITSFHRDGGNDIAGGKLQWRGGLVLTSPHRNFGGWSGLVLDELGRSFVAVSDSGSWMSGEIAYDGKAPVAMKNARIGPILTREGVALKRGRDRDAEAVALESGTLTGGTILIAFEQNTRIARYDFAMSGGVSPTLEFLALPPEAKRMRRNSGFEAMTVMRAGAFKGSAIAFSERLKDKNGHHTGWIWSAGGTRQLQLTDLDDHDIVDVASLGDGSLIVLERRFRWLQGLSIRVRRVGESELASAKPIVGEKLLEADLTSDIDNMEGIAVSRDADGAVVLTLIADDNFNHFLQRTVLLQFALADPAPDTGSRPQTAKARP